MAIVGSQQNKTQRLAFNAMLKHAHQVQAKSPGTNFEVFEISRKVLMDTIDYTSPNRKHLKTVLDQMQQLRVQWDILGQQGGSVWKSCVMLPYVEVHPDKIVYSYAPQIKDLLFEPTIYAMLDLRIQRKFSLDCAAALYEWVNRFRSNPSKLTTEMEWEQWRWVIYGDVQASSVLHEYKIFKRDKLKPAIAEINDKSDLVIELIENKDGGRSVKRLQFTVNEKPLFQIENTGMPDSSEWDHRLDAVGITIKDRKKILLKYSPEVIEAHYNYTMKRVQDATRPPLKNIGAYLKHALENGYAMDQVRKDAPPAAEVGSVTQLMTAMQNSRNSEAAAMFAEMPEEDQASQITQYNALQTVKGSLIPETESKRAHRHMAPFYVWLAKSTWGEPTLQEVMDFGVKQGLIAISPTMAQAAGAVSS